VIPGVQGSEADKARALVERLAALPTELALPTRLREVGIAATDIVALAEDAMRQTRLLVNNPREIALEDAKAIYEEVL
jgi:alcohol dehydrogenase class IV